MARLAPTQWTTEQVVGEENHAPVTAIPTLKDPLEIVLPHLASTDTFKPTPINSGQRYYLIASSKSNVLVEPNTWEKEDRKVTINPNKSKQPRNFTTLLD